MSFGPQQQTVGVAEHREVTGILCDLADELAYGRHDCC
jgi:hypothetical protein